VKRFNYLRSRTERAFGVALPSLWDDDTRRDLWWYVAAIGIVCAVWLLQQARYQRLERDGASLATRLALIRVAAEHVSATERDLARMRRIATSIARVRASGRVLANELATIGNTLPDDAWLTSVRIAPRALSLEGRSRHVRGVAATLAGLSGVPGSGPVRLLAMRLDAARSEMTYSIALGRRQ
jgi:Tfp pilus assembly protein PilN